MLKKTRVNNLKKEIGVEEIKYNFFFFTQLYFVQFITIKKINRTEK